MVARVVKVRGSDFPGSVDPVNDLDHPVLSVFLDDLEVGGPSQGTHGEGLHTLVSEVVAES